MTPAMKWRARANSEAGHAGHGDNDEMREGGMTDTTHESVNVCGW